MPRAGGEDTGANVLAELKRLASGKELGASSNAVVKDRLRKLTAFLKKEGSGLEADDASDALEGSGFAKEILREAYTGKDAPRDAQILAACAITEINHVTAPTFLFEGHAKKLAEFIMRQFHHLAKAARDSETYQLVYSILDGTVRSGFFTLVTDPDLKGGLALVCEVFDIAINRIAPAAGEDVALMAQLEALLKGLFDDMGAVHEDVLDLFLAPLGPLGDGKASKNKAGRALVKAVVRRFNHETTAPIVDYVHRKLQKLDDSLMLSADKAGKQKQKDVVGQFKVLIKQILNLGEVHRTLNASLLPEVAKMLNHEVAELRGLATQAMANVFTVHTTAWTEFGLLFNALLKKFQDVEKEIRMVMIKWTARFLPQHRDAAEKVCDQFQHCVLDGEADIRKEALKVVLELSTEDLSLLPGSLLVTAIDRIRDKRASVRSFAMDKFAELYAHLFDANDGKPPAPFNQIPSRILEMYAQGDVDVRRDAERLIATVLLPEEETVKPGEGNSPLTFALATLWTTLPETCRTTLARLIITKHPIRELVSSYLTLRPKLSSKDAAEKTDAHVKLHKILTTLHSVCVLPHGLEQLLLVKDEAVFKGLAKLCKSPQDAMELKTEVIASLKKVVKGVESPAMKALPKVLDILLSRMSFPVSTALVTGCQGIYSDMWTVRNGRRAVQMSELLSVIFKGFPDVCCDTPGAVEDLVAAVVKVADEEIEHEGWGGEDDFVLNPPPASPRSAKRLKTMTLEQRRQTLIHLLTALKAHVAAGESGVAGVSKAEVTALVKTLKKLALNAPTGIAKLSVQVLHSMLAPAQRGTAFAALASDCLKALDAADAENYKTVALLKVVQHCLMLQPPVDGAALGATAKFATQVLSKLNKQDIPTAKGDTFKEPPLACLVYRAALKVFTAYILALPNKLQIVDNVRNNFRLLNKYCETIGYMTMYEHTSDARNEIGRVLHKDLMKNKLPMSFAQLLCLTLVDRSRANFAKAKARVCDVIAHFRTRCTQYTVKLDSMQAPGFCPEYILPSLIHLLSRWHFLEELGPSYDPIQRLLFIVFDKLTERKQCTGFLFDLLSRLKGCDDAQTPESTNTRLIVDICFVVLKSATNTKEVKFEPFPGVIHIPTLFVPPEKSNAKLRDPLYIDVGGKFVAITKRNDRNNNPMGLAEDDEEASPTRGSPKKKSPSKASPKAAKASPKRTPAGAGSSTPGSKRKLDFDGGSTAKKQKTAKTPSSTAASSKSKATSKAEAPAAKKAKKK